MKSLLFAVLLSVSTTVLAISSHVDVSRLTPEQRAEVQLQVERVANKGLDPSSISASVRQEASQWADLGKNVGTALVASAKEVGQSVNEFSQTPVGQITTAIIVYKVIGKDILALIFGSLVFIIGTCVAYYCYNSLGITAWKYENVSRLNGLWVSRKLIEKNRDEDYVFGATLTSFVVLLGSWAVSLILIF